jgi:hypothetical protein
MGERTSEWSFEATAMEARAVQPDASLITGLRPREHDIVQRMARASEKQA